MKFILINPPTNRTIGENFYSMDSQLPPLGLLYLASSLEKVGHNVNILDYCMEQYDKEKLLSTLSSVSAVGITVRSFGTNIIDKIITDIQEHDSDLPIIIGGPHCTIDPITALKELKADICVEGDGEHIICEIADMLQGKKRINTIPGIYYNDKQTIHHNHPANVIMDLDSIPFPARHLVEKYNYGQLYGNFFSLSKGRVTSMLISRGCPSHCTFCQTNAFMKKYRVRSANNIIEEIEEVKQKYDFIYFVDDNFFLNNKISNEILDRLIEKKSNMEFSIAGARVDFADDIIIKKLKKAGAKVIAFGIESGNQDVLDFYNKKITLHQIEHAVNLTKRYGLYSLGYFMFGAPMETEKHLRDTINFAKKIKLDFVVIKTLHYLKGSQIWTEAFSQGKCENNEYVIPSDSRRDLGNFTPEELDEWSIKAYKEYYLRPGYFLHEIMMSFVRKDFRLLTNSLRIMMRNKTLLNYH